MLNLVPFARSGRQVTHEELHLDFVRQLLQLPLPSAGPRPIAPSGIRRDQQGFCPGINTAAHRLPPPPADALDRKRPRIMVDPHIDPALVPGQVVTNPTEDVNRRRPRAFNPLRLS